MGLPSLLRRTDAEVCILFFRARVGKSKFVVFETFINLTPRARSETESNVVSVLHDGAEL